jgi:hypothetical protein
MGNCAAFKSGYVQLPGLGCDFAKGLTLQAWINPAARRKHCRIFDLGRGERRDNIILAEDGESDDIAFAVYQGDERGDALVLKGAFKLDTWTHIAVTVASDGSARGYVNGKLVAAVKMRAPKAARGGSRTRCFIGRSNWAKDRSYEGMMAELSIWERVLTAEAIAAGYKKPLVGTETGLLGYWPLSGFTERGPEDLGRLQLHGAASSGVTDRTSPGLPVQQALAAVTATRALVIDYIPFSAFPADRPMCGVAAAADAARQRDANVAACGQYTPAAGELPGRDTIVTCPVWEISVRSSAETFDVVFDRDVELVTASAEGIALTRQKAGVALTWAVPPEGVVRVRLPAGPQLELPCATLRTGAGTTRLSFPSIGQLASVTTAELSAPSPANPGAAPPLPAGTSAELGDAVTLYLRQLACAAPVSSRQPTDAEQAAASSGTGTKTYTSRGWYDQIVDAGERAGKAGGDVLDGIEDLANGVGDSLEDVGERLKDGLGHLQRQTTFAVKGAQSLVVYTADAAAKLIESAAKVAASTTASAIETSIKTATKLCVSRVNAAANLVEIVGETAGGVFRLVVQGLAAAVSAVRAFFERVGLFFRDLAAWLASLLSWLKFRQPVDDIHDWVLAQMDHLRGAIASSTTGIDDALARTAAAFSDPRFKSTKVRALVPRVKPVPGSAELDFVISHVQDALSVGFTFGSLPTVPALSLPLDPLQQLAASLGALRLDDPYEVTCGDVSAALSKVWGALVESLRTLLRTAAEGGARIVDWIEDLLTTRIVLPFFTSLFEKVLFPGWELTVLRLVALTSAIPALLSGWSLGKLKKTDLAVAPAESSSGATTDRSSTSTRTTSGAADEPSQEKNDRGDGGSLAALSIATLVFESMAFVVSTWENLREARVKAKGYEKLEETNGTTGSLAIAGGVLAFGVAVCGLCAAPLATTFGDTYPRPFRHRHIVERAGPDARSTHG